MSISEQMQLATLELVNLGEALLTLKEGESIPGQKPINSYRAIREFLNSRSISHARYAAVEEGGLIVVMRLADGQSLKAFYADYAALTDPGRKRDSINEFVMHEKVNKLIDKYLNDSAESLVKTGGTIIMKLHPHRIIPYRFLQTSTASYMTFKTHPLGPTGALRAILENHPRLRQIPRKELEDRFGSASIAFQIV